LHKLVWNHGQVKDKWEKLKKKYIVKKKEERITGMEAHVQNGASLKVQKMLTITSNLNAKNFHHKVIHPFPFAH
jgi:hypothetical protein